MRIWRCAGRSCRVRVRVRAHWSTEGTCWLGALCDRCWRGLLVGAGRARLADIARDPGAPAFVLEALVAQGDPRVVEAVASRGPQLPADLQERLIAWPDAAVREALSNSRVGLEPAWSVYRSTPSPRLRRVRSGALVLCTAVSLGVVGAALGPGLDPTTAADAPPERVESMLPAPTPTRSSTSSYGSSTTRPPRPLTGPATTIASAVPVTSVGIATSTSVAAPGNLDNRCRVAAAGGASGTACELAPAPQDCATAAGPSDAPHVGCETPATALDPCSADTERTNPDVDVCPGGAPMSDTCTDHEIAAEQLAGPCETAPPTPDDCPAGDYSGDGFDGSCGAATSAPDNCPSGDYSGAWFDGACGSAPPQPDQCARGDYSGAGFDGSCGTPPVPDDCPTGDLSEDGFDGSCGSASPPATVGEVTPQPHLVHRVVSCPDEVSATYMFDASGPGAIAIEFDGHINSTEGIGSVSGVIPAGATRTLTAELPASSTWSELLSDNRCAASP